MFLIKPDELLATGKLEIILTDSLGKVKDHRNVKNTVTISGKKYIASRMKDTVGGGHTIAPQMSHMAIGTGTSGSDNNMENEVQTSGGREALSSTTVSDNTVLYVATFPGGGLASSGIAGNVAVTEAGIFNYANYAETPGTNQFMLCRTTFAVVNKLEADTLTINWTVTIN